MSFIWPEKRNEPADAGVRFGRVLHWAAILIAAGIMAIALMLGITMAEESPSVVGPLLAASAVFAFAIYLVGRGLRYILSGE